MRISLRVRSNEELFDFLIGELGRISGVRRTQTYLLPLKIKEVDSWLPRGLLPEEPRVKDVKVEDK